MLEYFQEMLVFNDDQYEALVASYLDFKQHSLSIDVMPCHQLAYYLYNRIKEGCDHICFHHELMHITNFQCLFTFNFINGNLVGATLRNLDYCIIAYFLNTINLNFNQQVNKHYHARIVSKHRLF